MPIRIPPDAAVVRDCRLTLIRAVSSLYDRFVDGPDSLKADVKATMARKGVRFAESEFAVARLQAGGGSRDHVDVQKLVDYHNAGRITRDQLLSMLSVRQSVLPQYLSGDEIAAITTPGPASSPSLVTEFKPDVRVDLDALGLDLVTGLIRQTATT